MDASARNIKGYTILEVIGEGGMGKVYKAMHPTLKRVVALKSMLPNHYNNPEARKRFSKDGEIISLLRNPNIIQVYDYFEDESGMYLVMEFFDGVQLDEYILKKRGLIPHGEAIQIMTKLLDGLEHAHTKNIIHRDIKPANILIDTHGNIKIIDFGVAEMIDEEQNLAKTMLRQASGSPYYMSPEQILCERQDYRTDIYSAGLVMYYMVTGKNPFDGVANYFELQKKKVEEVLPPPSSYYPMIPNRIDRLIERALHRNREKRFQSCDDFSRQLQDGTIPDNYSTFQVIIGPVKDAVVTYGEQGSTGANPTFTLEPMGAQLVVLSEGYNRYSKMVGLKEVNENGTYKVNLEPVSNPSNGRNFMGIALLILVSAFVYATYFLFKYSNQIRELQDKLQWYNQHC
jgi:serine/threonine protein kinase